MHCVGRRADCGDNGLTTVLSVVRDSFLHHSYLVDPASSHMLVSKIKPCMSKYKHPYTSKLRTAHYISNYLFEGHQITWITVVILELIHAKSLGASRGVFIR